MKNYKQIYKKKNNKLYRTTSRPMAYADAGSHKNKNKNMSSLICIHSNRLV